MIFLKNISFFILYFVFSSSIIASDHFDGAFYAKQSSPQYTWAHQLIKEMKDPQHPFSLLDVGCGSGKITIDLSTLFPHAQVVGIDPSPSMIKEASSQNAHVEWRVEAVEQLKENDQYDIVTSFSTLHWIKDLDLALKKIHHAMKVGGTAYFVLCAKTEPAELDRLGHSLTKQRESPKWKHYFKTTETPAHIVYWHTAEAFKEKLEHASFKVLKCVVVQTSHIFHSKKEFYDWVCGWSPYAKILKGQHEAFWMDVIDMYAIAHQQKDGSIEYIDYMLNVIVRK